MHTLSAFLQLTVNSFREAPTEATRFVAAGIQMIKAPGTLNYYRQNTTTPCIPVLEAISEVSESMDNQYAHTTRLECLETVHKRFPAFVSYGMTDFSATVEYFFRF